MYQCSWKEELGEDCPTCGAQRSFDLLMNGQVGESIQMFPATIPFLLTIIFLLLHLIFKFKHGSRVIVILFILTVSLIVANFIVKLMNGSAFE
ncbi:MAG: DUF2752 domain-containing protein [Fluviicola sp.]|nr:DUF2752 domain-containing protein [Fluviicola sp.]